MAEAWARELAPTLDVASAGSVPEREVNPHARAVMAEAGVSLEGRTPKGLHEVDLEADVVVTLCDDAAESCPNVRGSTRTEHWGLPDPARAQGTPDEVLEAFRQSRDDIRRRIARLVADLQTE